MKKIFFFLVAVIILVGGVFVYSSFSKNETVIGDSVSVKSFVNSNGSETVYSNCPTETEERNFKPKTDKPEQQDEDPSGGPASHNVYNLISSNQTTFVAQNQLLLSGSSVPEVVKTFDGRVLVYFIAGTAEAHGMRVAEKQTDGSLKVLDCITFDGDFDISTVDPNVVLLPDGRLRMTYLSNFGEVGKERTINSAISTDGINFTVESIILSGTNYSDPTETLLSDGDFLLAVPGIGDDLDFYISSDGKNFQKQSSLRNNGGGFGDLVTMPDGSVRLYVGSDTLRMYESDDNGRTWKAGSVVVSEQGFDQFGIGMPSVLLNGSKMEIFYISSKGKTK